MTREEAIQFLKGYLDEEVYTDKCRAAHDMAIKALEKEPCEDAISRADILEEIEKLRMSSGVTNQSTWNECVDVILRTVRNRDWFPSVQPTLIKASDIKPDDEWMKENEWDEIYKTEREE